MYLAYLRGSRVNIAYWRAIFCECTMRVSPPPHPARPTSPSTKHIPLSTMSVSKAGMREAPTCARRVEGPILRMRNARRPTAASDATHVHKHRADVYGHGRQSYFAHIGGPGCELAGLRALFCEYATQGALPTHPTLLVFANIKQTYTATVDKGTSPIFEGPGAYRRVAGLRSHFCEYAM